MTATIEEILGHRFANPGLLREAMTHRSALAQGHSGAASSNERLEFVGDRVLGLLMAEWLAERYPEEPEGHLGRRLAHLVSQPVLSDVAHRLGFEDALFVSPGESRAGVRRRATVLADALEAAIGALYLDAGIEPARGFVRRAWLPAVERQSAPPKDFKSALQERLHALGKDLPQYEVLSHSGPPHAPSFTVSVCVDGRRGTGTAGSKRAAEQCAAEDLLRRLSSGS